MLLEVKGLKKSFEGFMALNGVSLDVKEGEVVAVIGPNGAGKTTLFNLITGHIPSDGGKVIFQGRDITNLPPYRICKMGIARAFQVPNIFQRLTVMENVQIPVFSRLGRDGSIFSDASKECTDEVLKILEEVGLLEEKGVVASNLSHGDQKLLEIAMALASRPKLLLLDEPTAGMSPEETVKTVEFIKELHEKEGISILFTEHDMDVVFSISDRIFVMQQGRVIASGSPQEVRSNPEVKKAYLGE